MPLDNYRKARMVVLHPRDSAYEAARAMHDNRVGAVLISEAQTLLGIVTDRDLALEVVAQGHDPREVALRDIMATDVTTIGVDASVDEALSRMRERGTRRLPVLSNGHLVGLVTLDDIITRRDASLEGIASVVEPQIAGSPTNETPAQIEARSMRAAERRRARSDTTYGRLLHTLERQTGMKDRSRLEQSLLVVLRGLCQRVRKSEAEAFIAQLPSKLHGNLIPYATGPNRTVTTDAIASELSLELGLDTDTGAELVYSVCEAITDHVSAGEIYSLRGELPRSMKELFPAGAPMRRAA